MMEKLLQILPKSVIRIMKRKGSVHYYYWQLQTIL